MLHALINKSEQSIVNNIEKFLRSILEFEKLKVNSLKIKSSFKSKKDKIKIKLKKSLGYTSNENLSS
jgi:hypothetical protein